MGERYFQPLSPGKARQLTSALLGWFEGARRDLPWRGVKDPYAIWVSEAILQQTRIEQGTAYYHRFLDRFPTIGALAAADLEEVLSVWEGLGYYSRARNLHRAARQVVEHHGGVVPADPATFRALPGVGPYTTGAVLSMAYGVAQPALDGNALRVLTRLLLCEHEPRRSPVFRALEAACRGLIPPQAPGAFNQALMELGSLVCRPANPSCDRCPWAPFCRARAAGRTEELPVRRRRRPPRQVTRITAVIRHPESPQLLVVKRPPRGLLGGLWGFPGVDAEDDGAGAEGRLVAAIREQLGIPIAVDRPLIRYRHVFSHLRWEVVALCCRTTEVGPLRAGRWHRLDGLHQLPFPKAFAPILEQLGVPWKTWAG